MGQDPGTGRNDPPSGSPGLEATGYRPANGFVPTRHFEGTQEPGLQQPVGHGLELEEPWLLPLLEDWELPQFCR